MTTPAERIVDEAVLHRVALGRYSTTVVRRVLAQLNRVENDIIARISRADNEGRDPAQLERLLEEVRALQADGWLVLRSRLGDDLNELADAERLFAERLVRYGAGQAGVALSTNVPTTAQVVAAVNARPFQGRFLREWLEEAEAGQARRVRETVRQGFVEGRSVSEIVRTIRGTRANQFRDGILEINRRGAEAMVRTAITHTSAVASRTTYEAMGVAEVTFVAVLDSRTTITCAALNGRTFPLERFPWPPRHVNCRSTAVPQIRGLEPVEPQSFDTWLRRQPVETQNEVLGPTRARLWREGRLTLDRFTDRAGNVLTLEQLRRRDAGAFEGLGLD